MWDAIVCTCSSRESAVALRKELHIRQGKGLLSSGTVLLAVDDPRHNIGSGSATLNALLCVTEYLAAQNKEKAVSADPLYNAKILILLLGSTFPFSPCGHAFMPDPSSNQPGDESISFDQTEIKTNVDRLMCTLERLCRKSPPGVWVSSTDMLLTMPDSIEPVDVSGIDHTVAALTVSAKPEHASLHGACRINENGEFAQIVHLGGSELVKSCIRPDGLCDMLVGVIYMSPEIAAIMLSLHTFPPLDSCTYVGLDNGALPLSLSLFFDILLCLTTDITKEDYIAGTFKQPQAISSGVISTESQSPGESVMRRARAKLWKNLREADLKMKAVPLPGVEHHYMRLVAVDVLARYQPQETSDARLINSILPPGTKVGNGTVIINCNIQTPVTRIGANCFLSGLTESFSELQAEHYLLLPLTIPDELTVQEISVGLGRGKTRANLGIVVVYGVKDNLVLRYDSPGATFCNRPWSEFFERTGIEPAELWLPEHPKSLLCAKLFVASHPTLESRLPSAFWLVGNGQNPKYLRRWRSAWRVSLLDIIRSVDAEAEFTKVRAISFELQRKKMMKVLKEKQPVCLLPFFRDSVIENKVFDVLATLDQTAEEVNDPLVICRVYACIADTLAFMAKEGGIRGGPAANKAWRIAFTLLEKGEYAAATRALATERANWIQGDDRIIRASRHYERAGQILTRLSVATARQFISGTPCELPAIGQRITVTAPIRVDFSGAWSDTPPQAYEWGGAVITVALTINKEYPIKVVVERTAEPRIELILGDDAPSKEELVITELSQMEDYSQPHAPGALLKAAFICAGIIEFPSSKSLKNQLTEKFGSGFKLQSVSNVPKGSGLGTSSILGGAILAALWRAAGQKHSHDSLIHAVLHLEQLLTTGGGWQDQCGGLYGGVKVSRSYKGLPVKIYTEQLDLSQELFDKLERHLLLVYTGVTRLARNLLQDVLRNWHSRNDKIIETMKALIDNTNRAAELVSKGDMAGLGEALNITKGHKLVMAPGSFPRGVVTFIDQIQDFIYGCTLTGAAGGGFLVGILKDPAEECRKGVMEVIKNRPEFVMYDHKLDPHGLQYSID